MRDSLFVALKAPGALVASPGPALKRWTNGLRCCEEPSTKTTTGWTRFWPQWNHTGKGKLDEQVDADYRRRYARGCDEALRCASGGRVPRPHRSEINPEMVARS